MRLVVIIRRRHHFVKPDETNAVMYRLNGRTPHNAHMTSAAATMLAFCTITLTGNEIWVRRLDRFRGLHSGFNAGEQSGTCRWSLPHTPTKENRRG